MRHGRGYRRCEALTGRLLICLNDLQDAYLNSSDHLNVLLNDDDHLNVLFNDDDHLCYCCVTQLADSLLNS